MILGEQFFISSSVLQIIPPGLSLFVRFMRLAKARDMWQVIKHFICHQGFAFNLLFPIGFKINKIKNLCYLKSNISPLWKKQITHQ